jgi:Ca2+-binding RTX toxin-like protein
VIQSIRYTNSSDTPPASLNLALGFQDGGGQGAGGNQLDVELAAVTITAVADAPVAQDDEFTTDEVTAIVGGNLFADNGHGLDLDLDGPPLGIAAVNGLGGNVGTTITLASGALLTVNANGTFDYDPNGAFDPAPPAGSGAVNTPASDSFTYTLASGGTATVSFTIAGIDNDDELQGTGGSDLLSGGAGNDTLYGLGGNDRIAGGTGNDTGFGGLGDDLYAVDSFSDQAEELSGEGNDRVLAAVSYALGAGSEIELLSAANQSGTGALNLIGNSLAQTIIGNDGVNTLLGGGGNDVLFGLAGNDIVSGGTGDDTMVGGMGHDSYGVDSNDDQVIEQIGQGSDRVLASVSYTLGSGMEVELLSAADQSATTNINLAGNELANNIQANEGDNILIGGGGNDTLYGLGGNDTLNGGDGSDLLIGGAGADDHVFRNVLGAGNIDLVLGFVAGSDRILLDDAIFTGLSLGALSANAFRLGNVALDADDRILYDQVTGNLFFDADGNGSGSALLFARLDGAPVIAASDFQVI